MARARRMLPSPITTATKKKDFTEMTLFYIRSASTPWRRRTGEVGVGRGGKGTGIDNPLVN